MYIAAKKKSPISSMNSHLKSTLGNDTCESDGDEFMSKPIPKKKGKKSKFKSQGGQFDSSVDKCKFKSAQASSHLSNLTILHTPPSYRR